MNKTNKFTLTSIGLLTLGFLAISWPKSREKYEDLTQQLIPKTVTIMVTVTKTEEDGTEKIGGIIGSGVFVTDSGHILTAAHLFDHGYTIKAITVKRSNEYEYPATMIYKDSKKDLALIRIEETGTPFAVLENPRSIKEGQEVIAIGAPLGLEGSVTTGIISAVHRDQIHYDMIQMSAPINPGNSGGPLFNLKGRLVGINVNIFSMDPIFPAWSGIGFSVSASEINKFLAMFPDKKTVGRLSWTK